MSYIKILEQLFIPIITNPYVIVSSILAILMYFLYTQYRGFMGEFWVKRELKKLPKDKYKVLNNIMVEYNNSTHQIDHIVISQYGIFIIEMKNYYGLILGNDYSNNWIQYLGKNKNYFYNPTHQNYGHIKAIEGLLNCDISNFISIICFSNQATLKTKTNSNVVHLDDLVYAIEGYKEIKINNDISEVANNIAKLNIKDKSVRRNHIKSIRRKRNK